MKEKRRNFIITLFAVWVIIGFVCLIAFLIQLLWNGIVTKITIAGAINFWQSLGLLVLVTLLTFDKSKFAELFL